MGVRGSVRGWICSAAVAASAFNGMALAQHAGVQQTGPQQTGVQQAGIQQTGASAAAAPATSLAGELRSMASRAGVVFVGQVQSIAPEDGVVAITFLVQQPVLGAVGATYTMREWAGRWTGGRQRYRVGQRAMFFLHAPSAAGLSSPVDGMMGAVPLIPMGANAAAQLDARWLETRVQRTVGSPMASSATGAISLADAETVVANWRQTVLPEPVMYPMPKGIQPRPVTEQAPVDAAATDSGSGPVAGPVTAGGPLRPQEARSAEQ